MQQVDREGTFLARVTATAFGVTKKSDLPRVAVSLVTTKKYADTQEELTHYGIAEAGYVPFAEFEITAYLCLYTKDLKESKNYEQVIKVLGWDGVDFQTLNGLSLEKEILIRVSTNSYTTEDGQDKSGLQVAWIDTADASPVSVLQPLAVDKTAALTAKFLKSKQTPPPAAKPAATAPKTAPAPKTAAPPTATAPAAPKTPPTKAAAKVPPAAKVAAPPPESMGLSAECSKLDCWNYINSPAVKADNEDSVIEGSFFDAIAEVAPGKADTELTPAEWAKVRDVIVKDLKA